ncbi:MAG: hypothetical protein PHC62_03860 [Candidatus Izemoplasmatales bacterium]|nr:hypothetical protein [Candidatus Izemoplasmatales bacterium]
MAIFFKFSTANDVIAVEELLLKKYDFNHVKKMPIIHGVKLIKYCFKKDLEEVMWPMYISDREKMTEDTFLTFNQYMEKLEKPKIEMKDSDELLDEIDEIRKEMEDEDGGI